MSSTNRKSTRNKHDYYVTPISAITTFLTAFHKNVGPLPTPILDPCAGGDATHPMSYPTGLREMGYEAHHIVTSDIRADSLADFKGKDYLQEKRWMGIPNTIITNPPFNLAFPLLRTALVDVKDDGYVIFLLRLNFFGSKERNTWLRNNMPEHCFIHAKRIKFTEGKSGDSIEYAHFVWRKGFNPDFTKTYLLKYE